MNVKTIAGWAALAFVVWLAIAYPHSVATVVAHVGDFLRTSASGLSGFVSSI